MKKLVIASLLLATPAFAQQAPQIDPEVAVYKQLLDEANGRIAAYARQFKAVSDEATKKIADLEKRVKELEQKPPAPAPEKKAD